MANSLTKKIMNNIVKQSPYQEKKKEEQNLRITGDNNLNKNQEDLLLRIMKKNDYTNNYNQEITGYIKETRTETKNSSMEKAISLEEFVKRSSKNSY